MKIRNEDLQKYREDPLELFYQGIRDEETRDKYSRTLRRTLCEIFEDVLDGTFEDRASQIVNRAKKDPDWMIGILLTLKKIT